MKKQDMIKQIQQTEASMFLQCKQDEHTFGSDSSIYKTSRAKWNGVYELMNELGIKPDYTLDENNQVIELINMLGDEQVEVQIASSGTIYEAEI
jgi:hypothetical protein